MRRLRWFPFLVLAGLSAAVSDASAQRTAHARVSVAVGLPMGGGLGVERVVRLARAGSRPIDGRPLPVGLRIISDPRPAEPRPVRRVTLVYAAN